MQTVNVLFASADIGFLPALPEGVECLEVLSLDAAGLMIRDQDGTVVTLPLAPIPCLGLLASRNSAELMRQVQTWFSQRGIGDAPDVLLVDSEPAALIARALLERLLTHTYALARAASLHARHVASLRTEVETLASQRAGLDRFIGDLGIAELVCSFATTEPDYETQIELSPGVPLRQLLPVASTGWAAIDLACTAGSKRRAPLRVTLSLVEEGRANAIWEVAPPTRDGWIRLGLPRAYAGLTRTLALVIESASERLSCTNLALSGVQPLVAAQLSDVRTGESIAPHSLAMRLYAAVPGTSPPHAPGTVLPIGADVSNPPPYALRAIPSETLAQVVADAQGIVDAQDIMDDQDGEAVPVNVPSALLHLPDLRALLCRPGGRGHIPAGCPSGARGLTVHASVHGGLPCVLDLDIRVGDALPLDSASDGSERYARQVALSGSQAQAVVILFPEPLQEAQDITIAVRAAADPVPEATWAVLTQFRIYT
ncbi:hypothetical protein MKK68_02040 [Methylobacterium sp. E-016]|uniref:DUF6212 domain-containing protein n=1 Tax=Methylobacterium sp. E-016 TaxID=2836556 RepID=UPI001FB9AB61|nr:DUF6212 domain-containing protein [Methylobacterium sp. E-016]MCJ2074443.1 hypothetical protein [Methylobacterium sp. E-016]